MLNKNRFHFILLLLVCTTSALDLRRQVSSSPTPSLENAQDQLMELEDALNNIPIQIIEWIDESLASVLNIMSAAVSSALHPEGGTTVTSTASTDFTSITPGSISKAAEPSTTTNITTLALLGVNVPSITIPGVPRETGKLSSNTPLTIQNDITSSRPSLTHSSVQISSEPVSDLLFTVITSVALYTNTTQQSSDSITSTVVITSTSVIQPFNPSATNNVIVNFGDRPDSNATIDNLKSLCADRRIDIITIEFMRTVVGAFKPDNQADGVSCDPDNNKTFGVTCSNLAAVASTCQEMGKMMFISLKIFQRDNRWVDSMGYDLLSVSGAKNLVEDIYTAFGPPGVLSEQAGNSSRPLGQFVADGIELVLSSDSDSSNNLSTPSQKMLTATSASDSNTRYESNMAIEIFLEMLNKYFKTDSNEFIISVSVPCTNPNLIPGGALQLVEFITIRFRDALECAIQGFNFSSFLWQPQESFYSTTTYATSTSDPDSLILSIPVLTAPIATITIDPIIIGTSLESLPDTAVASDFPNIEIPASLDTISLSEVSDFWPTEFPSVTESINGMETLGNFKKRQIMDDISSISGVIASIESGFGDSSPTDIQITSASYTFGVPVTAIIDSSLTADISASEASASSKLAEAVIIDTGILPVNLSNLPPLEATSIAIPLVVETSSSSSSPLQTSLGGGLSSILSTIVTLPTSETQPTFTQKLFVGLDVAPAKSGYITELGPVLQAASRSWRLNGGLAGGSNFGGVSLSGSAKQIEDGDGGVLDIIESALANVGVYSVT